MGVNCGPAPKSPTATSGDNTRLASCKYCGGGLAPGAQCEACGARAPGIPNPQPTLVGFGQDGTPILRDVSPRPKRPKAEYMRD